MSEKFSRTAVIAVDFQNDCIEPTGAWPIFNKQSLLDNAGVALDACRRAGIPIIYTQHWLDPSGVDAWRDEPLDGGRPLHSVAGEAGAEIHPRLTPRPEDVVVRKQRFSAFYETNLDLILRHMRVEHVIMLGLWSEACFETTVWDALWREYRITIVKDACGTATELMHMTAMLDLANWLYAGEIIDAGELAKALSGEPHRKWRFERPAAFSYTIENVRELYDSL